jgi:hypothetical protein
LKLDKKQEALNAFKNASEMPFDSSIQEASLNYAKLSYEIEFVPKRTCGFVDFIKKYPNNASRSVVENY